MSAKICHEPRDRKTLYKLPERMAQQDTCIAQTASWSRVVYSRHAKPESERVECSHGKRRKGGRMGKEGALPARVRRYRLFCFRISLFDHVVSISSIMLQHTAILRTDGP